MMRYLPIVSFVLLFTVYACGGETTPTAEEHQTEEPTQIEEAPQQEDKTYQNVAFAEANPEVTGQEIEYSTANTKMTGYLAFDDKVEGKRPGVLVIHEWWGHNDYARKRAEMLAELGYVALAVDMYGDGKKADHPNDAGKFSGEVFSNMDEAKARFEQAMTTLKAHPMVDGEKLASIGYCFGGSVSLAMANAGYDLDAVAAFHSGVQLPIMPTEGTEVKAEMLVANGAADPFIPVESVAVWSKAMEDAGVVYEYVAFDNAKHAYTDPGATAKGEKFELPLEYNEAADRESWMKLQALLDRTLN
ncbi:MAG: dienelactone hydrolase family protein [Bacteroidota bacterium]